MSQHTPSNSPFDQDTWLIILVVCAGILITLLMIDFSGNPDSSTSSLGQRSPTVPLAQSRDSRIVNNKVSLANVPLATGDEPIPKLFIQSGCAACHTIPGILAAKGREGPRLLLGTNGPKRLADPDYQGRATTVREYIIESILSPGAYVVPGYPDRVMPRWYGKKLSANALEKIASYLERVTE